MHSHITRIRIIIEKLYQAIVLMIKLMITCIQEYIYM